MDNNELIPVLISWKGPGENVYVCKDREKYLISDGYRVLWVPQGELIFNFLVDDVYQISELYDKVTIDETQYNYLIVEKLPDEISQIKYLTLQEIEIIDQEMFQYEQPTGREQVNKITESFEEDSFYRNSISDIIKNPSSENFMLKSIIKIQSAIRRFLSERKYKVLIKSLNGSILLKKHEYKIPLKFNRSVIRKDPIKIIPNFKDFRKMIHKTLKDKNTT
ncbi:hypothetical protein SteCoe_13314 [Stentor coeruleus]|uniref:Uncharacterized protein n=1 Tax=Stentor coeruleus TaxID=5963 RepID=A0A1R2C8R4_9CILI|nr:hypothetical protein SteCoe_13314 [Stentor coeruleus]